jgi:hypothetical protein
MGYVGIAPKMSRRAKTLINQYSPDSTEAALDLQLAGAMAPSAQTLFVYSGNVFASTWLTPYRDPPAPPGNIYGTRCAAATRPVRKAPGLVRFRRNKAGITYGPH